MTDTTRPTVTISGETTSTATATTPARPAFAAEPDELPQYSRGRVLKIWAAAALPMAALAWVGAPLLAGAFDGPSAWPRAIVVSLTAGLVWQFALVLLLVHREQGSLRWPVVKEALWLRAPRSPRTGRSGGRLWPNTRQLPPNAPPTLSFTPQLCLARTLLTATGLGVVWAGEGIQ